MLLRLVCLENTKLKSGSTKRTRESRHNSLPDTNNDHQRKTKSPLRESAKGGDADVWAIVAPPKFYCYIFTGKILEERGGGGARFGERSEKV